MSSVPDLRLAAGAESPHGIEVIESLDVGEAEEPLAENGEFLLESAGVEPIAENGGGPGWLKKVKAEG